MRNIAVAVFICILAIKTLPETHGQEAPVTSRSSIIELMRANAEATRDTLTAQKKELDNLKSQFVTGDDIKAKIENLMEARQDMSRKLQEHDELLSSIQSKAESDLRAKPNEYILNVSATLFDLRQRAVAKSKEINLLTNLIFEDFSDSTLGAVPDGWRGNGLLVQEQDGQRVLLRSDRGSGTVELPIRRIEGDFFAECVFTTNGYVNRKNEVEILMIPAAGGISKSVKVIDSYPNVQILIDGRSFNVKKLGRSNLLRLKVQGNRFHVELNGEAVHSREANFHGLSRMQLTLTNSSARQNQGVPMIKRINAGILLEPVELEKGNTNSGMTRIVRPARKKDGIVSGGRLSGRFTWGAPPEGMAEHQLTNKVHWVKKSDVLISDDFFLEFTAIAPEQFSGFGIVLEGQADGQDLNLTFNCDNVYSDGYNYRVSTPDGVTKFAPTRGNERRYRLQRVGKVFTLTCDSCRVAGKHEGNVKISQFLSGNAKSFSGIRLGVDKASSITDIRFGSVTK